MPSALKQPVVLRDPYNDRAVPPEVTVARLAPHLASLGITRVARQTGLDHIGIPCFAAFRPNARTLSNSQGKGLTDEAARASAIMEALEFALAERGPAPCRVATIAELKAENAPVYEARNALPIGTSLDPDQPLPFVMGRPLFGGEAIHVPLDVVLIAESGRLPQLSRSTSGLASGNTESEAVLHAIWELVERDAVTLARYSPRHRHRIDIDRFGDDHLAAVAAVIENAGCDLWLYELTSDIGIPVYEAVIGCASEDSYRRRFDLASGFGCHPVAARAAIRAVTEAAQTRITNIAGSRDDFDHHEYEAAAPLDRIAAMRADVPGTPGPGLASLGASRTRLAMVTLEALARAGIGDVTVVPIGGADYGVAVVKVLAPQLEDCLTNRNWRPGKRAIAEVMAS